MKPKFTLKDPETRVYVGDCRKVLAELPEKSVDLVFADPPFNWNVDYGAWDDSRPREDYLDFTYAWLDGCQRVLTDRGSLWVNIPDDTAAEIVVHLKKTMTMINWCIWHFRFGQNRVGNFIVSKVHTLYFAKDKDERTWNPDEVLEPSDRASIYGDKRTFEKEDYAGVRVPFDVWYGQHWGRVQGNNKERRGNHQNQLPEVYLERVIRCSSNPGDLVLDPFLGSGTTCTVARALGRRSIGIEFNPKNAASAFERIEKGAVRIGEAPEINSFFSHRAKKKSATSPTIED